MTDKEQYQDLINLLRRDFCLGLKWQRVEKNISIEELCEKSYLTKQEIEIIEGGEKDFNINQLLQYLVAAELPMLHE